MIRSAVLAIALSGCCADTAQLCAEEYGAECVQDAFDSQQACGSAAANAEELDCAEEFEGYLDCLQTANDCGSCELTRLDWNECATNVCAYSSRIDRGCFADRPDCGPVFDEGNTPPNCLVLWRSYMLCLARSSPDEGTCDDQCIDIFIEFWSCDADD
ncbi:MAG: hypothetical protein AB8H86_22035 [Polyangiales bacterium]